MDNKLSGKKNDEKFEIICETIGPIAGKNSRNVLECLFGKKDVNEFLIAKKTEMTINQIRNILYKLSDEGLVSFIRKKDKKKGWYTYFWTFDCEKSFILLKRVIEKEIEQLENQLKSRETKQFYSCKICHIEVTEENALLHEYTCSECGEIYEAHDNQGQIKQLKNAIDKMNKKLNEINNEINIIEEKRIKKNVKEKAKTAKKTVKKVAKKTTKKISKKTVNKVAKKTTKKISKK